MKWTCRSISSCVENPSWARSRSTLAISVPRFASSSRYRGTGLSQTSQSTEKSCRKTWARSAAVSESTGLRAICSSLSTADPEAYASSCSSREGAQFATARARSFRSRAAAMSL